MGNPWLAKEAMNRFIADALRPPSPITHAGVVVRIPDGLSVCISWEGDQPGHSTVRIEARLGDDGSPVLHVQHSEELPPDIQRRHLTVI